MGHSQSKQLNTAVKEERWKEVDSLLRHSKYNSSVVEQFIAACEENYTVYVDSEILSHCTSQQWNQLLETAVKIERWEEVNVLLRDRNYGSSVVEQFITACEQYDVIHVDREIVSQCNTQQLDRLLTLATTLKQWDFVGRLLKAGDGNHEKRVWVIEQACQTATEHYFDRVILPNVIINEGILFPCSTELLDRLLTAFATKGHWKLLGTVLESGAGSREKRVWVIEQALTRASYRDFVQYFLPHINKNSISPCSSQHVDRLLTTATTAGRWIAVDKLLEVGGSLEKRQWVIEQANEKCENREFLRYMMPHVSDEFLFKLTSRRLSTLLTTDTQLWYVVDRLLKAGGGTEIRAKIFEKACQEALELEFRCYILPHCDDQTYNHIVRGFNSVLFSAVLNEHSPQGILAECIRLGFSTHQPLPVLATTTGIANAVIRGWISECHFATVSVVSFESPFLLAVSRGLPVVAHMLYESGSCSYTELLRLYTVLLDLSDPHTESGRKLLDREYLADFDRRFYFELYSEKYKAFMNTLTTFLPYLREMASTPRSLESSCRLVISHCLYDHGRRNRAVQELPVPEGLKDYLLFSDLTDPDYQPRMYKTMSAALLLQK